MGPNSSNEPFGSEKLNCKFSFSSEVTTYKPLQPHKLFIIFENGKCHKAEGCDLSINPKNNGWGVDTIASHFWCVGTVTKVCWKQAK